MPWNVSSDSETCEVLTMRIGVLFPTNEITTDPSAIRDYAQAAEDLGYTHLETWDHVAGADLTHRLDWDGPGTLRDFHEPFVLFGYLASVTRRIDFVTGVLVLPQRQTVLVAKQAAQVDVLCGGRLRLGVGVGWVEPEFQALNEDFRTRGQRIEEQIAVLRALFTQEAVTFHGRWHHIEAMGIKPRPIQQPIPIWLGGDVDATMRRVAAMGDGWLPLLEPGEEARAAIAQLRAYTRDAERDPRSLGIEVYVTIAKTGSLHETSRNRKSPDEWRREVAVWEELGATHLTVNTMEAGLASPQAHIDTIRRFKEEVR
jgi:probable F420-dependent oxidoreductase